MAKKKIMANHNNIHNITYMQRKRAKRRQCGTRRWSVRPLNTSRDVDGESMSLVLPMNVREGLLGRTLSSNGADYTAEVLCLMN